MRHIGRPQLTAQPQLVEFPRVYLNISSTNRSSKRVRVGVTRCFRQRP